MQHKIKTFFAALVLALAPAASPVAATSAAELAPSATSNPSASDPIDYSAGCDPGYYLNPATGRCNKIKVCKTGYVFEAATNTCHKLTCPFGYKAAPDGTCQKLVCDPGYILSVATGNCVKNGLKDAATCPAGLAYDSSSKSCKEIIPTDAPACEDEEYLNRAALTCHPIVNLAAYDAWLATDLVATNDSTTRTNGALDPSTSVAPLSVAEAASSSGHDSSLLADITAPEYVELRALVAEYLEEQAAELEDFTSEDPADEDPADPDFAAPGSSASDLTTLGSDSTNSNSATAKVCPAGKVLSPATGRCRTAVTVSESTTSITTTTYDPLTDTTTTTKTCKAGYTLNSETNRCKKDNTADTTSAKVCPAGQFLNPKTNRCKNLTSVTESATAVTTVTYDPLTGEATTVKTCKDGYELNPETNRCKKATNPSATTADGFELPDLGTISESPKTFIALAVVIFAAILGLGFALFEFRHDLTRLFRKLFKKK